MDSVQRSAITPSKSRLARTFAKVLHIRAVTGIAPVDGVQSVKTPEDVKDGKGRKVGRKVVSQEFKVKGDGIHKVISLEKDGGAGGRARSFDVDANELGDDCLALEALVAKLFASVSTVKAAYAQLQYAQSPYDADGIQVADQVVVAEFKSLSELKQCYLKKQFDPSPERALVHAEIQEQRSVLKTFQIMAKKLESQLRGKDSEIALLKAKLEEAHKQNRSMEKRLNQSGPVWVLDKLHISGLNANHFITLLRHAVKSIRSFVRMMIEDMKAAGWDIDAAASAIEPGVVYGEADHKCLAFESFVCREMFSAFQHPNFSLANESLPVGKNLQQLFFERFVELKAAKAKEYLSQKPRSIFAKFCRRKYLQLVHPKMESSLFGSLTQRNMVNMGEFPATRFFNSFLEMAKRVWLLHCLAFSLEPQASIFQVRKGCRYSEVYMEGIFKEGEFDPQVAFTVVPGFRIGKTTIQCQVYLAPYES